MVMYTFLKRDQQNFLAKELEKTFAVHPKTLTRKRKRTRKKKQYCKAFCVTRKRKKAIMVIVKLFALYANAKNNWY